MKGFTLVEVLVVIIIFSLIMGVIYSSFWLSQKAYQEGETSAELTQNGRVILERIIREIRQAKEIVSDLPSDMNDAVNFIEFEDGHIEEDYHYIRYFQEDNFIKREVVGYYFSGESEDPPYRYRHGTPPPDETLEEIKIEEARIIGEFVHDLKFWSSEIKIINIFITLENNEKQLDFSTSVFGRNL